MLIRNKSPQLPETLVILNCNRLPARLNATEAAVLLGFSENDLSILTHAKLLVPLGKPAPNAPKYFAAIDILNLSWDRDWLSRATRELSKHWLTRNRRRNGSPKVEAGE